MVGLTPAGGRPGGGLGTLAAMRRDIVIVAGMIAGDPYQGGATWAVLQYVLGLGRLGHDVVVVDPLPAGPIRPDVRCYFDAVCHRFGLGGRAALVPTGGGPHGMSADDLAGVVAHAAVLVNLSGRWRDHDRVAGIPVRAYIDLDPAFTQLWYAQGADVGLASHTHHVTVGAGIISSASQVPTAGVTWRAILPPVVLERWPAQPPPAEPLLTTVANWRSYGSIEHDGTHYGQKAHAFRRLTGLPAASPVPIAVALSIHPGDDDDRRRLVAAGWRLLDPVGVAGDPDRYQSFVQGSWGELGVAKSGYVAGQTAWVSDRTACYLASGRPAIVQDTGLGEVLPVGAGLLTFDGVDDGSDAIRDVVAEYDRHAMAARRIAETHLDARNVLSRLMRDLLA